MRINLLDSECFCGIIINMEDRKSKVIRYLRMASLVALGYVLAVYIHLLAPSEGINLPPECVILYNYAESEKARVTSLEESHLRCWQMLLEAKEDLDSLQCEEGP